MIFWKSWEKTISMAHLHIHEHGISNVYYKAPAIDKIAIILHVLLEACPKLSVCILNAISNYFYTFHISEVDIWCRSESQWGRGIEAISCSYSYLHSRWLGILLPWTCCWYDLLKNKDSLLTFYFYHQELKADPAISLLQNCVSVRTVFILTQMVWGRE